MNNSLHHDFARIEHAHRVREPHRFDRRDEVITRRRRFRRRPVE